MKNNKKNYLPAELEIVETLENDIITTSDDPTYPDESNKPKNTGRVGIGKV